MKTTIQNLLAVEIKYLPATNTLGSRVRLHSPRLQETKIIPFDYSLNSIDTMAIEYLTSIGQQIMGEAETKEGYVILCEAQEGIFRSIKNI